MGQVKLAFTNTNGAQMICTRSMQYTLKKIGGTFKSLEGQLMVMDNGVRQTISTRCADLDAQMPLYLGVSRAVLDNVIFCHQEESLWPLSEPSALKKKFDEIFESQKFTRVLENIKALRKEYTGKIKVLEVTTDHLKTDKERAERKEARANQLLDDIDRFKGDAEKIDEEIKLVSEEADELFSSNQKFQEILYELQSLMHEYAAGQDAISRLQSSIELLSDSDKDLRNRLESFETQSSQMKLQQEQLVRLIIDEKSLLDTLQRQYNEAIQREGKLSAENDNYQRSLVERQNMLSAFADKFGVNNGGSQREISGFLDRLHAEYNGGLDAERATNLRNENEMLKLMHDTTTDKLREEQKVISYRNTIRDAETKSKRLQDTIENVRVDEGTLAFSKQRIEGLKNNLSASQAILESISKEKRIPTLEASLKDIENNQDKLNRQLKIVNQEAASRAKLAFLKEDMARREKSQEVLISKNLSEFSQFGIDLNDSIAKNTGAIDVALKVAISEARKDHEGCVLVETNAQRNASELKMRTDLAKNELEKIQNELAEIGDVVEPIMGMPMPSKEDYELHIQDLISQEQATNEDLQKFSSFRNTAIDALDKAEKEELCYVCQRKFADEAGLEAFKQRLTSVIEYLERTKLNEHNDSTEGKLQIELEVTKENLAKARNIAPEISRLHLLREMQPDLEKSISQLSKELNEAEANRNQLTVATEEAMGNLSRIELLRRTASDLSRGQNEISNVRLQIEHLQGQLKSDDDNDEGSSSSEILGLLEMESEKSKKLRRELDGVIDERDRCQTQIRNFQTSIAKERDEIQLVEKQLEEKYSTEREIKHLREEVNNHKQEIVVVESELKGIINRLAGQQSELDGVKLAGAKREKEIATKLAELKDNTGELGRINRIITDYEESGRERELLVCQELVQTIGERTAKGKEKIEELSKKKSDGENALLDLKGGKRTLEDNLNLRQLQAENEKQSVRIKELDGMDAERDRQKYEAEASRLRNKQSRLSSQLAGKMGEIKQMDDQLNRLKNELETEYKTVADDYRASAIRLRATTVANDDLSKYCKAFESAIMKYHSLKMEEVNEIIDELWKKTYSGSDVDTILIRSEHESSKSMTTGGKAYRVCMVKQDVELDMRGRCSAGQKVLASIIIRLALAQCFGVSCGLIALDEPTTNLDSENIESLAKALSLIISQRKEQSNFQLIVITHDEKFLTHMNATAYTDHFFRVSRNDRQKSQIKWVPISRLME